MNKIKTTYIFIIGLISAIVFISFRYFTSVAFYERKNESDNPSELCLKIKDKQSQELCLAIIESNDFEKGLSLAYEIKKYDPEYYPWYDFPFYQSPRYDHFPGGIEKILSEGKNHDSDFWCSEVFLPQSYAKEDYYFCRAFLENPHFCNKIFYLIGPSKDTCYLDAALVWQDSSLCEKSEYSDFCYLRLVLKSLEN